MLSRILYFRHDYTATMTTEDEKESRKILIRIRNREHTLSVFLHFWVIRFSPFYNFIQVLDSINGIHDERERAQLIVTIILHFLA